MVTHDQSARTAWHADQANAALRDRLQAVDATHIARIKAIIAKHGWPGWKLVGRDGAQAAWLLVQHADSDHALQVACLALLETAVDARDASASDYAYLYDRVAVAEKRAQRYGTQFNGSTPFPIEAPVTVDARRAEVGLGTLASYAAEIRALDIPSRR